MKKLGPMDRMYETPEGEVINRVRRKHPTARLHGVPGKTTYRWEIVVPTGKTYIANYYREQREVLKAISKMCDTPEEAWESAERGEGS